MRSGRTDSVESDKRGNVPHYTKWASCSTKGNMTFNSELLGLDKAAGDYVMVHELLHFFAPNHGRLWKSLMRAHLGNYEKVEAELPKLSTSRT